MVDGQLVAMVEEERLNRIKHSPRMPAVLAMQYCLETANVTLDQVDYVAIGFDSALHTALVNVSKDNIISGLNQAAQWLRDGSTYEKKLPLGNFPRENVIFVNHHRAHAASAFFASGFPQANILSLDGSGGTDSGILGFGNENSINIYKTIPNRGSWGLIYEEITEKLGFRRHSSEGKVMGLASYGIPDPNGLPFVEWNEDIPKINPKKRKEFVNSLILRKKEDPITQQHKDLAATLQDTLEKAAIRMVEWLFQKTGNRNLCLSGGTALNCSMNGKLALLPFIDEIFIQPAAHDAGTALGAALITHSEKTGARPIFMMKHAYWGPEFSETEIEDAIKGFHNLPYKKSNNIFSDTAKLLKEGKIVGWFQGRSEIGPRALGNRSILADPSLPGIKDKVNNNVKHREPWRPFAPSILEEEIDRYINPPKKSPFMILAFSTLDEHRHDLISAAHIDGTIRPQTVSKETNPRYWQLIKNFEELTGIPAVLNTSYNLDSEPIVNSPQEALDTFLRCEMDAVALGDFIVWK